MTSATGKCRRMRARQKRESNTLVIYFDVKVDIKAVIVVILSIYRDTCGTRCSETTAKPSQGNRSCMAPRSVDQSKKCSLYKSNIQARAGFFYRESNDKTRELFLKP